MLWPEASSAEISLVVRLGNVGLPQGTTPLDSSAASDEDKRQDRYVTVKNTTGVKPLVKKYLKG